MNSKLTFNPGRVGVLLGGNSSERDISIKSGKAVLKALDSLGIETVAIGLEGDILSEIENSGIDIAFIVLHGRFGEDGQIQEFLEKNNIPYTGSGVASSRLAMDKDASRRCFRQAGLKVPPTVVINGSYNISELPFSFPVVVKPSREGSSYGLTLVKEKEKLKAACERAGEFDKTVLVEPFIEGMEVTAGILGNQALPLVEIVPANPFFDFEAKYVKGKTEFIVPARLPSHISKLARSYGLAAHRALGCRAYSRADMIVDPQGDIYLLEVNTIPGFTETSLFPLASARAGIAFPQLCLYLLSMAASGKEEI